MADDSDFEIEPPPSSHTVKKRVKNDDIVFPPPPPPPDNDDDDDDEDVPFAELRRRNQEKKMVHEMLKRRTHRSVLEAKRARKEESFRAASKLGKEASMKLFAWFSQESRADRIPYITIEDLLKFVFNMLAAQSPSIEDYLKKIDDFVTLAERIRNETETTYEMVIDENNGEVKVNNTQGLNSVSLRLRDAMDLARGRKEALRKDPVYAEYYKDPDYVPPDEESDSDDEEDE